MNHLKKESQFLRLQNVRTKRRTEELSKARINLAEQNKSRALASEVEKNAQSIRFKLTVKLHEQQIYISDWQIQALVNLKMQIRGASGSVAKAHEELIKIEKKISIAQEECAKHSHLLIRQRQLEKFANDRLAQIRLSWVTKNFDMEDELVNEAACAVVASKSRHKPIA